MFETSHPVGSHGTLSGTLERKLEETFHDVPFEGSLVRIHTFVLASLYVYLNANIH